MKTIDGRTQIVAVIGDPVEHSLSPTMHNAALEALGLNWAYIACHVSPEGVAGAVEAIRALNWRGMNVTVPHKQAVMAGLDELSDAAQAVGAVNTIIHRSNKLIGDNTDVVGIIRAVKQGAGLDPVPEQVAVLGAGGAARGIVYAMSTLESVKRVYILNRTAAKAVALAEEFDGAGGTTITGMALNEENACATLADAGLLINATNAGRGELANHSAIDVSWDCLHPSLVCVDSNYSPPRTLLMELVEAAGGTAYNGLDMLVYQGARSLELWSGYEPPVDVMRHAVLSAGAAG